MTRDGLIRIPRPNSANIFATALAAFALAGTAVLAAPALAQFSNIGDEVVVDLSVLGDGGIRGAGGAMQSVGGNLLLPPRLAPSSTLYVAPMSGAKLRKPSAMGTATASSAKKRRPAIKSTAAKPEATSAPTPIEKQVAAAIPAPPSAPPKPPAKPIATAPEKTSAPPPPPSPKPAVTAAAAPKPMAVAAKQVEEAAIPKGIDLKPGRALRLEFADGESKLTASAKSDLKLIGDKVRDNANFRVQLLAFAGGKDLSPSKARRMSLARALSVRSQLIESGLRSTQIDVRALGDKTTDKPVNRVDVNFVEK